jgi:hypothetical protein
MFIVVYTYHIEMEELRVGFNHMRQKFGLHSEIHYQCKTICGTIDDSPTSCVGSHATYFNITAVWEAVVCPKDPIRNGMPKIVCLGHVKIVDNLALYLDEEEGTSSAIICWKCFSMEKVVTKNGEEKKFEIHAYGN